MKDLAISAKSIRREMWVVACCLVVAVLMNVYAILAYKTQWIELLTTWHITLVLALGLYAVLALPRLCWAGVRRLAQRSKG